MGKNKTLNVKSSLGKALVRSRFSRGNREIDSSEKWVSAASNGHLFINDNYLISSCIPQILPSRTTGIS